MAIICPKCHQPNDDGPAVGGLLVCGSCQHRWTITVATLDALPTELVDRRAAQRPKRPGSDEYLPSEPATIRAPLTGRHDDAPGSEDDSALARRAVEAGRQQGPTTRSRRTMEVGPPAERANAPDEGPTIDADLFDQLEREAQARRASLATQAELPVTVDQEPATDLPTSDRSTTVDCPVCGHRFPGGVDPHHECPQCGTGWDDSSGRLKVSASAGDRLIGRTLGGCLIDRKLGEGGMGAVYHARQLSLDRSIAIKILPADLARNRNFIQRFEREAKSLARINHPNILHIYDFGEDPQLGLYFMLIEYVEGMDLGEVLNRRGALGQIEVLDLLRQALQGLEAASEKGVIHRDIKPDNLMVSNTGLVKVSDFGLAKGMIAQTGVTAAGVRVGTPAFMSPEQCDGIEVDVRSDIYNLGATAFLCLTGRLPFDGETPFAIMLKHKTEPVPAMTAIDPTIDLGVERLIQRMLAKRPADRCSSLRDLIEQVERLEVTLAGTQSILRKSRGPFRALLKGDAPVPVVRSERAPSPAAPEDEWRQLVADFQSQAAQAMPTAPAAPAPLPSAFPPIVAGSSGTAADSTRSSSSSSSTSARGSSRMPSAAVGTAGRGSASSRRLDAEMARNRGRRQEVDNLISEADLHQRAGRLEEAARALEAAARLGDDEAQRADLILRSADFRLRLRRRRLLLVAGLVAVGVLVLVAAAGVLAPIVHGRIADDRLSRLIARLPERLPVERAAELRAFADTEARPWWWYSLIFRRGYPLTAGDRARALADQEAARPAMVATAPVIQVDHQAVLRLADDPKVPWSEVLRGVKSLRVADALTQEVLRRASAELDRQRADVDTILSEWGAGEHHRALERSASFRERHQRADPALLASLPQPGRVLVNAGGGPLPHDLRIVVDGAVLALHPTGEADLDAIVCRRLDRPVSVEVSAQGYRTAAESLPAGPEVVTVKLLLRPQPLWVLPGPEPLAGATLWPAGPGAVLVDRRAQVTRVALQDGRVIARLERTPGVPTPLTGLLQPTPAGRWQAALDDNTLVQLSPDLVIEQTLYRARSPVLAWAEAELTYRPGGRLRLAVEGSPQRTLVAWEGAREWWRYPDVRSVPLSITQPPFLIRHEDLVFLIDDAHVHVIDEDGGGGRRFPLTGRRTGPVVSRRTAAGRLDLLVPTAAGVQHLIPGPRTQPLRQAQEPLLSGMTGVLLSLAGDQVVAVSGNRVVCTEPVTAVPRWSQTLAGAPVFDPSCDSTQVAVADAQGIVTLLRVDQGQVVRRLVHGQPLATAPLLVDGAIVVLDRAGFLTAYPR